MTKTKEKDLVVLLHGILRSKTDMLPLSKYLQNRGYETLNILYPSRKMSLEDLTTFVHNKITEHLESIKQTDFSPNKAQGSPRGRSHASDAETLLGGKYGRLHFVVHSMGGLITRYYIHEHAPKNLGRVVMLSPPNTGSEFADALAANKLLSKPFRALFGPASAQLQTNYIHNIGKITYPLGIIAGSASINPLAPLFIPRPKVGAHDGIVPVERTKIDGMSDHIVLKTNHSLMMFNPKVMEQAVYFLENEEFKRT